MANIITEEQVAAFVARCQVLMDTNYANNYPSQVPDLLNFDYGAAKKYCRIVSLHRYKDDNGTVTISESGSAWCFIDLTNGDVLKPASYKAPAKHARGNILDEHQGMKHMSAYGPAYLK